MVEINLLHKGKRQKISVRSAVYFDSIVYQLNSNEIRAIVYQSEGVWKSTDDQLISPELLNKIGMAINAMIQVGK